MPRYELTQEQVNKLNECINITVKTHGLKVAQECLMLLQALSKPVIEKKEEKK